MSPENNHKVIDRRSDVGQKMFIGIITAILSSVFIGSLTISLRATEKAHDLEIRMVQVEAFIRNQDRLNNKLTDFLESGIYRNNHKAEVQ